MGQKTFKTAAQVFAAKCGSKIPGVEAAEPAGDDPEEGDSAVSADDPAPEIDGPSAEGDATGDTKGAPDAVTNDPAPETAAEETKTEPAPEKSPAPKKSPVKKAPAKKAAPKKKK